MIIAISLVYIFLLLLILVGTYYIDLFMSREEFSRKDLTNLPWFFNHIWSRIKKSYPVSVFIVMLLASSFIGILIPSVIKHWFTNSSILFLCAYFIFPQMKKHYEQSQVTASEDYSDTAANLFVRYNSVVITGFGTGTGAILLYHIRTLAHIHPLWLLINIIIIIIILVMTVREDYLTVTQAEPPENAE